MHRGCIVWTPTRPLSGRWTPRPDLACVCVLALLGRVGRAGLPGLFWCASPFLWPFCPSSLFGPLRAGVARALGAFFSFPLSSHLSSCTPLSPAFCASRAWVPWALTLRVHSYPPLFFFFSFFFPGFHLVSSVFCPLAPPFLLFFVLAPFPPPRPVFLYFFSSCFVLFPLLLPPRGPLCFCFRCLGPWRLVVPPPPIFLSFFPLFFSLLFLPFLPPLRASLVSAFPLFPALGALVLGALSPPTPPAVSHSFSLFFVFFVVVLPSRFSLVPGALGALGLCSAWVGFFFLLCVRPCVWCVRCVLGLLSALFFAGAALLLRSRWLVLCVVACGCWVFAAGSGCPLLFSAAVLWRGWFCLAALLAALLCALVCCGVPLPCAVSCALWLCIAVWCRPVVPCCPFCFVLWSVWRCVAPWRHLWRIVLFFVVLCSVPPSCHPVPCSAGVWALFGAWCRCMCLLVGLVAWFCFLVARVGPGVLVRPLAARPAVWRAGAVSCRVLRPVPCPVVPCCLVVLCCLAVLCVGPCCLFSFFLLSSFPLQKSPAVSPLLWKLSENEKMKMFSTTKLDTTQLTHAVRQQYQGYISVFPVATQPQRWWSSLQGVDRVSPGAGRLS